MSGKQLLYIVIFTFLVTLVWVTSNIMHSQSEVQIPPETKQLMEPVNSTFDQETINTL